MYRSVDRQKKYHSALVHQCIIPALFHSVFISNFQYMYIMYIGSIQHMFYELVILTHVNEKINYLIFISRSRIFSLMNMETSLFSMKGCKI
jgi:hypothetical protein